MVRREGEAGEGSCIGLLGSATLAAVKDSVM